MFRKSDERKRLESLSRDELEMEIVSMGYDVKGMIIEGVLNKERQKKYGRRYRNSVKEMREKLKRYEELEKSQQ